MTRWFWKGRVFPATIIVMAMVLAFAVSAFAADGLFMPAAYLDAHTGAPVEVSEAYENGREFSSGLYYPDCMQVTHIEEIGGDYVTVRFQPYPLRGYAGAYEITAYVGDWCIGDVAAVVMYDNGTANVIDDSVVSARYITYIGGEGG